jgi:hypothetical protein
MALIGITLAQQRFIGHKVKSKFRPSVDWFANMRGQSTSDDSQANSEIQSDQPIEENFQDFYVDYEPDEGESKEGKVVRTISKQTETFQNICPYFNRSIISSESDPDHEFVSK